MVTMTSFIEINAILVKMVNTLKFLSHTNWPGDWRAHDIQNILDEQTASWGIKVTNVEIKHIDLNESMIRAIAKQAEAERERRAKVIHAEGELQASKKLLEAAEVMSQNPQTLQLRYLQTLNDISNENATTIVFPLPIDILQALTGTKPKTADQGNP